MENHAFLKRRGGVDDIGGAEEASGIGARAVAGSGVLLPGPRLQHAVVPPEIHDFRRLVVLEVDFGVAEVQAAVEGRKAERLFPLAVSHSTPPSEAVSVLHSPRLRRESGRQTAQTRLVLV